MCECAGKAFSISISSNFRRVSMHNNSSKNQRSSLFLNSFVACMHSMHPSFFVIQIFFFHVLEVYKMNAMLLKRYHLNEIMKFIHIFDFVYILCPTNPTYQSDSAHKHTHTVNTITIYHSEAKYRRSKSVIGVYCKVNRM